MCLESICKKMLRISVDLARKPGAVQPKVDPANMLIQGRFLKVWRVKNGAVFGASEVPESWLPWGCDSRDAKR
jgi:hypothetical protein